MVAGNGPEGLSYYYYYYYYYYYSPTLTQQEVLNEEAEVPLLVPPLLPNPYTARGGA